jgi:translation elongation factor EF-4
MDIVKERLRREFDIETIFTIPNVAYIIKSKNLNIHKIKSGANVIELVES